MNRSILNYSNQSDDFGKIFYKDPWRDPVYLRQKYQHVERGLHFYFRTMKLKMQARFVDLIDHNAIPRVFLHGSPHLDNYSRSERGVAMVDFDRSRIGPYAWDLVRLLTSVRFRQRFKQSIQRSRISRYLLDGFKKGFRNPHKPYKEMDALATGKPLDNPFPTRQYLERNKQWARQLRLHPLSISDRVLLAVFDSYLRSRPDLEVLKNYEIESAGLGTGSMGRERYLIVLAPKQSNKDCIFLDIKRVREDPDNEWYYNPYSHHGQRMIEAANLYAPGWEMFQGYASFDGLQFWGHQIPNQNIKLKRPLTFFEQKDFLYSVGTQIGRAHALSLVDSSHDELLRHLSHHFDHIVDAAELMAQEIEAAYQNYIDRLLGSV